MRKELKEAIWQLRERCCCEPEDYAAIDLIEAELKKGWDIKALEWEQRNLKMQKVSQDCDCDDPLHKGPCS